MICAIFLYVNLYLIPVIMGVKKKQGKMPKYKKNSLAGSGESRTKMRALEEGPNEEK